VARRLLKRINELLADRYAEHLTLGQTATVADGTAHFTYLFPFPTDTTSAQVTLTIDNEFLVQVSADNENWTTVLEEDQPITDGSNKAARTIDLTPYLGPASNGARPIYLKVSDSFPNDGWGGRVYHVTANIVE
jgi:hypothetical protein